MKRCPITYEVINDNEDYSQRGLHMLSPKLNYLHHLEYSAQEQRKEAIERVGKMSVQGVQAKLSAQLKIKDEKFELVDQFGHYILKPQHRDYAELPENEALTMSLAALVDIEVPVHGLIYSKDNSMTYFIKRFDRSGHNNKLPQEDFAQLSQLSRDTKYRSSMENIAKIINTYCSFPKIEAAKLFKLTLFNFLVGNEDMHLKNFSLITREGKTMLSPAYDLLNTTIALANPEEELALPLNGKKRNLTKKDFFNYYGKEKLNLNDNTLSAILSQIKKTLPKCKELIQNSFLSPQLKEKYLQVLESRWERLQD